MSTHLLTESSVFLTTRLLCLYLGEGGGDSSSRSLHHLHRRCHILKVQIEFPMTCFFMISRNDNFTISDLSLVFIIKMLVRWTDVFLNMSTELCQVGRNPNHERAFNIHCQIRQKIEKCTEVKFKINAHTTLPIHLYAAYTASFNNTHTNMHMCVHECLHTHSTFPPIPTHTHMHTNINNMLHQWFCSSFTERSSRHILKNSKTSLF